MTKIQYKGTPPVSAQKAVLTRRQILSSMAFTAFASMSWNPLLGAQDEAAVLPLNTPGLDHLDIIVPDVEASARFYMSLFNTRLHAQPFRGALRYFVLLGELGPGREVGYLAIGESRGRGTYIGHFCTTVFDYRRDSDAIWSAMSEQILAAGLGTFPGASGFGGIFNDPEGIEIQFLPAPDTLVTAAEPASLVIENPGSITPLGVDHVTLNVSDLDKALTFYRILYGRESGLDTGNLKAWFDFPASETQLILQQIPYIYGSEAGIDHFGIKTLPFDQAAASRRLTALGATRLQPSPDSNGLRFTDPDGITVELNPT